MLSKLLIAVTFHYVEERLKYLSEISNSFSKLANDVTAFVVTNKSDETLQDKIKSSLAGKNFDFKIVVPNLIGHPYLLTWIHFDIMKQYAEDQSISHFMYVEDDILIRKSNIDYWLRARDELRPFNLIPSFLRYEINKTDNEAYLTDLQEKMSYRRLPKIKASSSYAYLNAPNPYQGMYLFDRELLHENLSKFDPDSRYWGIRETATQGLTFCNVPNGFHSRNLFGYDLKANCIDHDCLIHHTPNNYANNPDTGFGKIKVKESVARPFKFYL